MDLKKTMLEKRLRSAVRDGDGRRLLELLASDAGPVGRLLYEMGSAAGAALADAVRVARTDEEMHTAIGWAGTSGDSRALDEVRKVLRQGSSTARGDALSTLLLHGTPDDANYIAESLLEPDERVSRGLYEAVTALERVGGTESLPAPVSAALAAARARRAEEASAALHGEIDAPLTRVSAAKMLVSLCNEIDDTFAEPVQADAKERRASLREDIAKIGRAAYEQGGEDFMQSIIRLVASASSHANYVSREWTGIGSWMG